MIVPDLKEKEHRVRQLRLQGQGAGPPVRAVQETLTKPEVTGWGPSHRESSCTTSMRLPEAHLILQLVPPHPPHAH